MSDKIKPLTPLEFTKVSAGILLLSDAFSVAEDELLDLLRHHKYINNDEHFSIGILCSENPDDFE